MNRFLASTNRMLQMHGMDLTYQSVANSAYNVEQGKAVPTVTNYTARMYPRHIRANQYQFPNLIGKEVVLFYLANNALAFSVKAGDLILYRGNSYKVQEFQEHVADGEVVLYRITTVRG